MTENTIGIPLRSIRRKEVLQYLNWRGSPIPPDIDCLIDKAITETIQSVHPLGIRKTVTVADGPLLEEIGLALPGSDIAALLRDCRKAVLFAVTLGNSAERLIRSYSARDLSYSVILDSCCSAAVESVCDALEEEIRSGLDEGLFLTDRFSPGYGDLPLSLQEPLIDALDTRRRIGLTLTDSCILFPRKSVTGIIGIADRPQTGRFRGCAFCSMFERCTYRKAGNYCGK